MDIKVMADILQQVGPGNFALIVVLASFGWLVKRIANVLPKAIERLVSAIENLGTTFAVHDARASVISQNLTSIQLLLQELDKNVANQENVERLHERLDFHFSTSATKEDIKQLVAVIVEHSKDCQARSNQLQRDVIGGKNDR